MRPEQTAAHGGIFSFENTLGMGKPLQVRGMLVCL